MQVKIGDISIDIIGDVESIEVIDKKITVKTKQPLQYFWWPPYQYPTCTPPSFEPYKVTCTTTCSGMDNVKG